MTRIGNSDQILRLLREQLKRSDKTSVLNKETVRRTDKVRDRPMERVRKLTAIAAASGYDIRHAVVRGLLAEQFGEAITNDAAFLTVAADVARIIDATPEGRALIDQAVDRLREEGGSL